MRELHVWSDSIHIGVFLQRDEGSPIRFRYDNAEGIPISLSLPRTGDTSVIAPKAFLENLLPESQKARWRMADRLGVDSVDTFDLLAGVDVTGGLVFTPSAEKPSVQGEARPLDDDELAAQIIQTRAAGSAWFARTEHCRFSLAGGQPKFTLANHNGTWLWPNIAIPSTHIIKPAVADCSGSDHVENAVMKLGELCGLQAAPHGMIEPRTGVSAYIVERFDRKVENGRVRRLHCEDIAQAMGCMPDGKYDIDAVSCIRFLHRFDPTDGLGYEFVRRLAFNVSSADSDSHGKNYSLMLESDGIRFSPMYDVSATRTWVGIDQDLAMRINDKEFAEWVEPSDWAVLAADSGLDEDKVVAIARNMAGLVLDHMDEIVSMVPEAQRDAMAKALTKVNESIEPTHDAPELARSVAAVSNGYGSDAGAVWVSPHTRNGYDVRGYWRSR